MGGNVAIGGHVGLPGSLRVTGWDTQLVPGADLATLAATGADVLVLLESGATPATRCLELLLAALMVPGRGLAGPSANVASTEQAVRPAGTIGSVERDAADLLRRYGHAVRAVECLDPCCLAVRREVLEAVPPRLSDDPGWRFELDLAVRAERAGWRAVWVGAAYVHRSAPTPRPDLARARGLLGPLPPAAPPAAPSVTPPAPAAATAGRLDRAATAIPRVTTPWPLVSATMPTRRPDFAVHAVRLFLAQDYPNRELVVVEDGPPVLAGMLPDDPRIRLVPTPAGRSIGALRNAAVAAARGELIVQWDDDDWYGPHRISAQVAALRDGTADITALRDAVLLDLPTWTAWRWDAATHRELLVRDVFGGTLAFRRTVWERLARYPARSLAEDAGLLDAAVRRGARLGAVDAAGLFVYVRHADNSWRIGAGREGWVPVPEPDLPAADRAFLAARSPVAPQRPVRPERPLVSCLMPTGGRRRLAAQAIAYFTRQDYPNRELVVVDDGPDPIADLIPPDDPTVVYHRPDRPLVLGAKRNLACGLARGEVLLHWDDDDWQSPHRISTQVDALLAAGADVTGSSTIRYYDPASRRAWTYTWPHRVKPWVAGATLGYTRALWERAPFPEVATGEDSRFVWNRAVRGVADHPHAEVVVGLVHAANTVPKAVFGPNWTPTPVGDVERVLGADRDFYRPGGHEKAVDNHAATGSRSDHHSEVASAGAGPTALPPSLVRSTK